MEPDTLLNLIDQAIDNAEEEKLNGQSSRELSLVITKLQEARMWRLADVEENTK